MHGRGVRQYGAATAVAIALTFVAVRWFSTSPAVSPALQPESLPGMPAPPPAGLQLEAIQSLATDPIALARGEQRQPVLPDASTDDVAWIHVVVTREGAPAAGATVAAEGIGTPRLRFGSRGNARGKFITDSEGRASFGVQPLYLWRFLAHDATERLAADAHQGAPPRGQEVTLHLALTPPDAPRFVHLEVLSLPSRAPLAGVAVQALNASGQLARSAFGATEGTTDAAGRVVVYWDSTSTLTVTVPGHTSRSLAWSSQARAPGEFALESAEAARATAPVPFELAAYASIELRLPVTHIERAMIRVVDTRRPTFWQGHPDLATGVVIVSGIEAALPNHPGRILRDAPPATSIDGTAPSSVSAAAFDVIWVRNGGRTRTAFGRERRTFVRDLLLAPGEHRVLREPWPVLGTFDLRVTVNGQSTALGVIVTLEDRPPVLPQLQVARSEVVVRTWSSLDEPHMSRRSYFFSERRADASGVARFDDVPSGHYRVAIIRSDEAQDTVPLAAGSIVISEADIARVTPLTVDLIP